MVSTRIFGVPFTKGLIATVWCPTGDLNPKGLNPKS